MRHRTLLALSIGIGLVAGASPVEASPLLVSPGSTLQVSFTTHLDTAPCPGTCDILALFLVLTVPQPIQSSIASADLSTGGSFLGSTQNFPALGPEFFFRSAGSLFQVGTTINFTSLQSGPFSGAFSVTTTQAFTIDTATSNVDLGTGTSANEFSYNPATATITSIQAVPVPEPASLTLLGMGLGGLGVSRYRRRTR